MITIVNFIIGLALGMFAAFLEHCFGFKKWFSLMVAISLGLVIWVILYVIWGG